MSKKLQILGSFGPEIDATLTQEGKAADAKATGDAISVLNTLVGDAAVSEQISNAVSQKSQVQIITEDVPEILQTLNIYRITQEEYDKKLASGEIYENALYLTPDEEIDLSQYATVEQLDIKADSDHVHEDINTSIAALNTIVGDKKVSEQISEALASRSQVQIITWEADD